MAHETCTTPVYLGEGDFLKLAADDKEVRAARAGFPNIYGAIRRQIRSDESGFQEQCVAEQDGEFLVCADAIRSILNYQVAATGFSSHNPNNRMQVFFRENIGNAIDEARDSS